MRVRVEDVREHGVERHLLARTSEHRPNEISEPMGERAATIAAAAAIAAPSSSSSAVVVGLPLPAEQRIDQPKPQR